MSSYAVIWEDDSALFAGKLELGERRLRLEGTSREGRSSLRTVRYDELGDVHMAPGNERIAGRPTLVVERAVGEPLRVGSVDGRGFLPELADQLTARAFARLPRGD